MKVLTFSFSSSMTGGSNKAMLTVISGLLKEYGHEITVVAPSKGALLDRLDEMGIPWMVYPFNQYCGVKTFKGRGFFRYIKYNLLAIQDRVRTFDFIRKLDGNFDVVYINDVTAYFGAFVAQRLRIPYVWHFRSLVESKEHYVIGASKLFNDCSSIISISTAMQERLLKNKHMPQTIKMINDGIPLINANKSVQNRDYGFHLVQCGRIAPEKRQYDAIRAIGKLKEEGFTDIYLHIAGSDLSYGKSGYYEQLKKTIVDLNIEKQVFFEGLVENMPEFREKMNCELMCSNAEPFGLVTLEGMRSGLVVIGSNAGGTKDIIQDGYNGLLYATGDIDELANKIKLLYQNQEKAVQIADVAYAFSRTHFTSKENYQKVNYVLESSTK